MTNWIERNFWNSTNFILKGKDFYISYNPNTSSLGVFGGDGEETALVKDDKYYILNGDFRKEYESIVEQGFDICKEFFDKKAKNSISDWSN